MEDIVSVDIDESKDEELVTETENSYSKPAPSIGREIETQYRLLRKNLSLFFRKHIKTHCKNILYITDSNISDNFILELQKRYPDKILTVLVPHFGNFSKLDKSFANFAYYLQNKRHSAKLYKYPLKADNIQVYGIYSKYFSDLEKPADIYLFQNMVHYAKCARLAANKLKPDMVHSENIPFYLGLEFEKKKLKTPKVLQTIHDFSTYSDLEPFWAAINLLDKNGMRKLCNDRVIKKNIAALFGVKDVNSFSRQKECLEYLYQNFDRYRKTYGQDEKTNENILIKRLNERVEQLFRNAFNQNIFNPIYYSIKNSSAWATNSKSKQIPDWAKELPKNKYLKRGLKNEITQKIAYPFDITNFRYYREYNKQYLVKEFSEKQIKTNFTDINLFRNNEIKVYGFLDTFYKGTLLFASFDNLKDDEIKTITNAVLKCFELKKNIQVVFNMPADFDSQYVKSFIDFLEKQPSLNGKWLVIEGEINLPQFVASSDIILLPTSDVIGIEDILYTALKNGCIPVTTGNGICGDIVSDIFDDMTTGFGFKTSILDSNDFNEEYTNTLLKGINFYVQNFTSWKILIENAINYDSSWNFDLLEEYNKIYDEILM